MQMFLVTLTAVLIGMPFSTKGDSHREVVVRTDSAINVKPTEECGRIYRGHIALNVFWGDGDAVAIPQGSPVDLTVRETAPGRMIVQLHSISVRGRRYVIDNEYDAEDKGGVIDAVPAVIAAGEEIQFRGAEISIPSASVLRFQPPFVILRPACRHCM